MLADDIRIGEKEERRPEVVEVPVAALDLLTLVHIGKRMEEDWEITMGAVPDPLVDSGAYFHAWEMVLNAYRTAVAKAEEAL